MGPMARTAPQYRDGVTDDRHAGRDFRLTDVEGKVARAILA